jgi:hypothetical protein
VKHNELSAALRGAPGEFHNPLDVPGEIANRRVDLCKRNLHVQMAAGFTTDV